LPVIEEDRKAEVFGHRVLREVLGPTMENEGNCTLRSLVVCTAHKYFPGYQIAKDQRGKTCSNVWNRREIQTGYGGGNPKEKTN